MIPKILVILGPTATGKSTLGVGLSKRFNGEVVSADSRQVYKGLDIGTGKVPRDSRFKIHDSGLESGDYIHAGVPHHLLDVADPADTYTVTQYKRDAEAAIDDILAREKLPIVVGGTGFYIQAIVDGLILPEVPPDEKLREQLEQKSATELFIELSRLDPARAQTIEQDNPRRLIRAIEIARALGNVPQTETKPKYASLQIGLQLPDTKLKERIQTRVKKRLENGWIKEAQGLLDTRLRNGQAEISPERLSEFGLGYAVIADFLGNDDKRQTTHNRQPAKIYSNVRTNIRIDTETQKQLTEKITATEWQYAKRQSRWFKRDKRIRWFSPDNTERVVTAVKRFLEN